MGLISAITKGASNLAAKTFGKREKPHAQVTGVVTDKNGEIQSVSYDGIPHKNTSQKLSEFNKKIDEKIKKEYSGTEKGNNKQIISDVPKSPPLHSVTWGGRPVGQIAGEAATNILRGVKKGAQVLSKSASRGYTQAKAGYIKAEPERQYLQFMSGVRIPKTSRGLNVFQKGKKRGRKSKEEKKAILKERLYGRTKERLYQQHVAENIRKNQGTGYAFSNFELPMEMSFTDSGSISSKRFIRKTDNPYDIDAHFKKAKVK